MSIHKQIRYNIYICAIILCQQFNTHAMDSGPGEKNTDSVPKNTITQKEIVQVRSSVGSKDLQDLKNKINALESKINKSKPCIEYVRDCCSILQSMACIFIICFSVYSVVMLIKIIQNQKGNISNGLSNIDFNDFF